MKVCIATPLYPPDLGGPATYARLLEELLPAEGIEVALISFSGVRTYPKIVRHIIYLMRVYKAAEGADLVLALDPVSTGLPALIAARMRRARFVVKVVGDYAWEQGRQRFGIRTSLDDFLYERAVHPMLVLLRTTQSHVARMADAVIVPSQYLKGIVRTWKVPEERIAIIYNAVELGELGVLPEETAVLPRPRIITAGRLVPWKGIGSVIDAVVDLRASFPHVSLVIVGSGPDEEALMRYAAVRLADNYTFTGALTHANTLATIADGDVFVLNSTYEGLSHLLIEALSLGRPVVASRVGGNAELIEDNVNGLLVDPKDPDALVAAVTRLLSDNGLRAGLARESIRSTERFSTALLIRNTKALFEALI